MLTSKYPTIWILRRTESSIIVIMISMMGSPTLPEKPLFPSMCVMTPLSILFLPYERESPIQQVCHPSIQQDIGRRQSRRGTNWSINYGIWRQIVFKACMSWILTPSLTISSLWRSDPRQQKRKKSGSTWWLALGSATNSPLCLSQWTVSLEQRQRICWNEYPYDLQQSVSRTTLRLVAT